MDLVRVYIDSSIFIEKNFNFNSKEFQTLINLVEENKVEVVLTKITIQEVISNISKEIEKSIQTIIKARNEAKIFRNFPLEPVSGIYNEIEKVKFESIMQDMLQTFLHKSKAKILSSNGADIDNIFNMYFGKLPPFGERKKKNEFPDAFILSALSDYAKNDLIPFYIVSKDKDFKEGVKLSGSFIYLESLEEFLNKVSFYYEKLAPLLFQLINENIGQVNELIEEKFLNLGFYLSDQEGDVDDVQVLKTPDFEIYLLCIEDNSAEFELTGSISYSAFITYDDLSTATYDSEDKILIPWHKVENTVEREEIIQANIRIKFSITEPYTFEIETVDIITPKSDVAVNAEEYEW